MSKVSFVKTNYYLHTVCWLANGYQLVKEMMATVYWLIWTNWKVGIHSFPAWSLTLKEIVWRLSGQVRILCLWVRYLAGNLYLWVLRHIE